MASKSAHLMVGVYKFDHAGGSFEVHLRSKSRFFCPTFQAKATWYANDQDMVMIDWGKFGSYEMALVKVDDPNDPKVLEFEGSVTGKPENWRKMQLKRRFSKAEEALFDSEWNFEHTSGQFPIEFRADGFNHFICNQFSAHSHWSIKEGTGETDTPTVHIDWGKYGKYDLVIAADGKSMSGSAVGQPDNWRKAQFTRFLSDAVDVNCADQHS